MVHGTFVEHVIIVVVSHVVDDGLDTRLPSSRRVHVYTEVRGVAPPLKIFRAHSLLSVFELGQVMPIFSVEPCPATISQCCYVYR